MRFYDRQEAGRRLAEALLPKVNGVDGLVLALPRGGVPVAEEIAIALQWSLDVWLVRKLGVPGQPELAMGAIALPKARLLNSSLIEQYGISPEQVDAVTTIEHQELLRRNRLYRSDRAMPSITGKTVLLVDDGVATGATMQVAIATLKAHHPVTLWVAVPVAAPSSWEEIRARVDQGFCLTTPEPLYAISRWYEQFDQVQDREVQSILQRGLKRRSLHLSHPPAQLPVDPEVPQGNSYDGDEFGQIGVEPRFVDQ